LIFFVRLEVPSSEVRPVLSTGFDLVPMQWESILLRLVDLWSWAGFVVARWAGLWRQSTIARDFQQATQINKSGNFRL
jgi:hypothetical protein